MYGFGGFTVQVHCLIITYLRTTTIKCQMDWAQDELPVVVRVHAMYIDSNMLSVTKYSFKIPFLYLTRAMTQMECIILVPR